MPHKPYDNSNIIDDKELGAWLVQNWQQFKPFGSQAWFNTGEDWDYLVNFSMLPDWYRRLYGREVTKTGMLRVLVDKADFVICVEKEFEVMCRTTDMVTVVLEKDEFLRKHCGEHRNLRIELFKLLKSFADGTHTSQSYEVWEPTTGLDNIPF